MDLTKNSERRFLYSAAGAHEQQNLGTWCRFFDNGPENQRGQRELLDQLLQQFGNLLASWRIESDTDSQAARKGAIMEIESSPTEGKKPGEPAQKPRKNVQKSSRENITSFRSESALRPIRSVERRWNRCAWRGRLARLSRCVLVLIPGRLPRFRPRLSFAQPFPRGRAEARCGRLQDSRPIQRDHRWRRDQEAWRACGRRSAWDL
jgi:hypothetical protein